MLQTFEYENNWRFSLSQGSVGYNMNNQHIRLRVQRTAYFEDATDINLALGHHYFRRLGREHPPEDLAGSTMHLKTGILLK
jgi:hypothetical protein